MENKRVRLSDSFDTGSSIIRTSTPTPGSSSGSRGRQNLGSPLGNTTLRRPSIGGGLINIRERANHRFSPYGRAQGPGYSFMFGTRSVNQRDPLVIHPRKIEDANNSFSNSSNRLSSSVNYGKRSFDSLRSPSTSPSSTKVGSATTTTAQRIMETLSSLSTPVVNAQRVRIDPIRSVKPSTSSTLQSFFQDPLGRAIPSTTSNAKPSGPPTKFSPHVVANTSPRGLGGTPNSRHSLQLSQLLSPPVKEPTRRQMPTGREDFYSYGDSGVLPSLNTPSYEEIRRPRKSLKMNVVDASTNTDHSGPIEVSTSERKDQEIGVDKNANLTVKSKPVAISSKFKFGTFWDVSNVIKSVGSMNMTKSSDVKETKNSEPTGSSSSVNQQSSSFITTDLKSFVQKQKSQKWECSDCMVPNDLDKDNCACCGASNPNKKPTEATKPSALTNPATTFNFSSGSSSPSAPAFKADQKISPVKPLSSLASNSGKSKWNCPTCMVPNDAAVAACVCCSEPNPNKKSDTPATESTSTGSSFGSIPFKFGFNVGAATSTGTNNSTSSATSSSSFTFGAPSTSSGGGSSSTFTFGAPTKSTSTSSPSTTTVSTGFKFGIPSTTSSDTKGNTSTETSKTSTTTMSTSFSFKSSNVEETESPAKLNPLFPVLKTITSPPAAAKNTFGSPVSTDQERWKCDVCSSLVPMDKAKCTSCNSCYKPKSFVPTTNSSSLVKSDKEDEEEIKSDPSFGPFFGGRSKSPMQFGESSTTKKMDGFSSGTPSVFGQSNNQFGSSGSGTSPIFGGLNNPSGGSSSSGFSAPSVASSGFTFSSPTSEDTTDSKKLQFSNPDPMQALKRKRAPGTEGNNGVPAGDEVDHKRKVTFSSPLPSSGGFSFGATPKTSNSTEMNGAATDNPFMKGPLSTSGSDKPSPFGSPIPALMNPSGNSNPTPVVFGGSNNANDTAAAPKPVATPGVFTFGASNTSNNASSSGGLFTFGAANSANSGSTFPSTTSVPNNNNNNSMATFKNPNTNFTLPSQAAPTPAPTFNFSAASTNFGALSNPAANPAANGPPALFQLNTSASAGDSSTSRDGRKIRRAVRRMR